MQADLRVDNLAASGILHHTLSQSPFLWSLSGSLKKSCCTSAFFSVTMSTCPCTQDSKVIFLCRKLVLLYQLAAFYMPCALQASQHK